MPEVVFHACHDISSKVEADEEDVRSWIHSDRAFGGDLAQLVNWPASYHNRAGGVTFADRHAEIHRWLDTHTTRPLGKVQIASNIDSPNNVDVAWLQERTSERILK